MFQFMKRGSTKDKDKEEKEKKKKDDQSNAGQSKGMTPEELNRLEEARTALLKKQGITEDNGSVGAPTLSPTQKPVTKPVKPGSFTRTDSSGRKGPPPITQPKPPKKGILKDKSNYGGQIPNHGVRGSLDDTATLEENTLANEILCGQGLDESKNSSVKNIISSFDRPLSGSGPAPQKPTPAKRGNAPARQVSSKSGTSSSSLKSESIAKEFTPVVQRPPSPVDKSYDHVDLQLPGIAAPFCPRPRELKLRRQPAGDFGFTLRKGAILERGGEDGSERKRTVIFAEPGGGKMANTGLLPGDRLIEVNDVNVEAMTREEIIEIIKNSGDAVRLKVLYPDPIYYI